MVRRRHLVIGAVALVAWTVFIAAVSHTHISSHPATAHHDEPIHEVIHSSPHPAYTSMAPLVTPTPHHTAHTTVATMVAPEKVLYESVLTLVPSKHHVQLLLSIGHDGVESLLSPLPLGLTCDSDPSALSLLQCGGQSTKTISSRDATIGLLNVSFGEGGTVTIRSASMGTYLSRDAHTHTITMDKVQAKSLEKWEMRKAKNGDRHHLFGVRSNYQADADSKCIVISGRQLKFGDSKDCAAFRLHRPLAITGSTTTPTLVNVAVVIALTYRPLSKLTTDQQFSLQTSIQMWFAFLQVLRLEKSISAAAVFCMDDASDIATIVKWAGEVGISSDNITTDMTGWIVVRSDCEKHPDFGNQPTYRGVFAAAEDVGRRRFANRFFVLHSNSDIILDASSVAATLRTTVALSASGGVWKPILVSGRRWNCDVSAIQKGIHTRQLDKKYLLKHCSLFGDNAQDYFIVSSGSLQWDTSRGAVPLETGDGGDRHVAASKYWRPSKSDRWNLEKHVVPPFVVGGIAFDNWFVSAMMGTTHTQQKGWVIDATAAVGAFHINHGTSRFASHRQPKSKYNLEMAHYCNGWAEGKVGVSPFVALPNTVDDTVLIHQRGLLFCSKATSFECEMPVQPPNTRRQNAFDGKWEAF